jgi:hypothetical protein
MFMTFPPYVAGPLLPVVVRVNAGAAPRFASAPAAVVAPVPPCPTVRGVVRPDSDVMLELFPDVTSVEDAGIGVPLTLVLLDNANGR